MNRKISDRLGSRGINEIKLHPWLKDIDFSKLYEKNLEPKFIPVSAENYNIKNASKNEPPIKDADIMTNIVNKKKELELYYFDPNDKKSFSSIFKRNDFQPVDPTKSNNQIDHQIGPSSELEKKLSLKENNSYSDICSNLPSRSVKQYAMSYCSNLSSNRMTRSLALKKSESKNY